MNIDALLEEVRSRVNNYGAMYGRKETADDKLKIIYAQLYEDVPDHLGSVAERDAWVRSQDKYLSGVEAKKNAYAEYKAAETYIKLLFAQVEVWRSEQATARQTDKVHR
jgi:hypothetical protein